MKHWMYIVLVGFVWMFMGVFLFLKGVGFLRCSNLKSEMLILISVISLSLGLLKGHFVLRKVVKRVIARILSLSLPISFFKVYDKKFYMIIFLMMALGITLKWLAVPTLLRGGVDLAVGIALMKGGIDYFVAGLSFRKISYL